MFHFRIWVAIAAFAIIIVASNVGTYRYATAAWEFNDVMSLYLVEAIGFGIVISAFTLPFPEMKQRKAEPKQEEPDDGNA